MDLLINAFHRTIHSFPDAELVIVGDGPELKHLKQQAAESGLTDSIRFIGAVYDPEKLGAYMNESTVYVLAGMGGLSINDAMTYGMPVLCSVCDGTERDLVFSSPALCKKMGKESERIIREKINIETVSARYLRAFTILSQA